MDPVTIIIAALVAGAAAGLKPAAEQAVKDAYGGLKDLLQQRFGPVDLRPLEADVNSKGQRLVLEERLRGAEAVPDGEPLAAAQKLIELVQQKSPETASQIGIELDQLTAGGDLSVKNVHGGDKGFVAGRVKVGGSASFEGVTGGGNSHPNR